MVETVAREVTIDRAGNPRLVMRKFNVDAGVNAGAAGGEFGHMLNATEEALRDFNYEKAAEKDREALRKAVMQKIYEWGLFKYLKKRGEMGIQYRMKRTMETTGPGLKRVTDKQLDIEMDSVNVLVMCNPLERPDRTKFISETAFNKELKRMKIRIDLPLVTGHPTVHIMPQGCLSFTLRGEAMIKRNFEGIRYEIYDERDERHRISSRKYRLAQDGRSLEGDEDAEADLWVNVEVKTQEEIEESMLEEPVELRGVNFPPSLDLSKIGGDVSEVSATLGTADGADCADLTRGLTDSKPVDIPPESDEWKKHGITFQNIYNRAEAGEAVQPMCKSMGFDRQVYYRLRKEHIARMEAINGSQTTDKPSGDEGSAGQHPEQPESG